MLQFFSELTHDLFKRIRIGGIPSRAEEQVLGSDQAVEAGGGEAKGANDEDGLHQVGRGGIALDQTAGEEAQDGDLFGEALEVGGFQIAKIALVGAAGVEAVLEGVQVARLGATGTLWFGRGR